MKILFSTADCFFAELWQFIAIDLPKGSGGGLICQCRLSFSCDEFVALRGKFAPANLKDCFFDEVFLGEIIA